MAATAAHTYMCETVKTPRRAAMIVPTARVPLSSLAVRPPLARLPDMMPLPASRPCRLGVHKLQSDPHHRQKPRPKQSPRGSLLAHAAKLATQPGEDSTSTRHAVTLGLEPSTFEPPRSKVTRTDRIATLEGDTSQRSQGVGQDRESSPGGVEVGELHAVEGDAAVLGPGPQSENVLFSLLHVTFVSVCFA